MIEARIPTPNQDKPASVPIADVHVPPKPGKGRVGVVIAVVLLILGVVGIRNVVVKSQTPPPAVTRAPEPVLTVAVEKIGTVPLPQILSMTGPVAAIDPLSLGAELSGLRIDTVLADESDYVHKGQVLATLDATLLRAQLEQAQARLSGSRAAAVKSVQPNRPEDIQQLEGALRQAEAAVLQQHSTLAQAESTLKNDAANAARLRSLLAQGFVTQQDAENAFTLEAKDRDQVTLSQRGIQVAEAVVAQARARLAEARLGGRNEDVLIAQSTAAQDSASIHQLEAQIEQTYIRAPDDGLITHRDAHVGDITSPAKVLFSMARRGNLEVRGQVSEADLKQVHVGSKVVVKGPHGPVTGRVFIITPQVDPVSHLATIRIAIPSHNGFLPGMFAQGNLDNGARAALVLPVTAVLGPNGDYHVFVYRDGHAHQRQVTTGARIGNNIEITGGVVAGDPIIVDGGAFLNDGDTVQVSEAAHPGTTGESVVR